MLSRSTLRRLAALGAAVAVASLAGAEARAAGGKVVVKSDPPGANVYLDSEDEPRGVTPLELADVSSGLHKVRVSLAGYAIQTRGFYLAPGGERQFDFTLAEAGGDEPAPAAPREKPEREAEPAPAEKERPAAEEEKVPKTIDVQCPVCQGSKVTSKMGCAHCRGTGYVDLNPCDKCGGSRRVEYQCPGCKGEGKVVAGGAEKECPWCKGVGRLPCRACEGTGTIKRPNPEAASYPTTDCPACSGSSFLQEAQCAFCGGSGSMWIGTTEATAGPLRPGGGRVIRTTGTGNREKVSCPYCNGERKGKPLCGRCRGRAFQGSGRSLRPCDGCYGTGLSFIPCPACRGCGWVRSRERE